VHFMKNMYWLCLSMFHLNDTCHYWPILANRLLHKCIFVVVALGWCRRLMI
jgi:hypothetical protein